jgi:glycosyltransferase involved in cell wall biosynthesis
MRPSKAHPANGLFVQNQVDALASKEEVEHLLYLGIRSMKKGFKAVLLKYLDLLLTLFSQAIFNRKTFDVIHVHYYFPTIWYALIYKFLRNPKVKIIVTFHGGDVYSYPDPKWFYRVANRFVAHRIFVSQGLKDSFFKPAPESTVLSAGILDRFSPSVSKTPKAKIYDILMIGHLIHRKGVDRLVNLMKSLDGHLNIGVIGEGPDYHMIENYSGRHTLTYLGMRSPEQVISDLHQSKFLLSAARDEAFGLVMSEAMGCGVPVIATTTAGALVQVKNGQNGFHLNNEDEAFSHENAKIVQSCLDIYGDVSYDTIVQQAISSAEPYKLTSIINSTITIYKQVHS